MGLTVIYDKVTLRSEEARCGHVSAFVRHLGACGQLTEARHGAARAGGFVEFWQTVIVGAEMNGRLN